MTESSRMRRGLVTSTQAALIAAVAGMGSCYRAFVGLPWVGDTSSDAHVAAFLVVRFLVASVAGGAVSGLIYKVITRPRAPRPALKTFASNPFDPRSDPMIDEPPAEPRADISTARRGAWKVFRMINAASMIICGLVGGAFVSASSDSDVRMVLYSALGSAVFGLIPGLLLSVPALMFIWPSEGEHD